MVKIKELRIDNNSIYIEVECIKTFTLFLRCKAPADKMLAFQVAQLLAENMENFAKSIFEFLFENKAIENSPNDSEEKTAPIEVPRRSLKPRRGPVK